MKKCLLAVAVAALVAVPAAASTFVAMDEAELMTASSAVVQGRVLDVRSYWTDDRSLIVSEARVLVEDLVAGEAPGIVVVKTFGGRVGDFKVVAHGFPSFVAGERVLLFLGAETEGDVYRVTGYRLGQYRVRETAKGLVAEPTLDEGVRLITRDGVPAPRPRTEGLELLKERIRERGERIGNLHRQVR
jgi:hypothetical protein